MTCHHRVAGHRSSARSSRSLSNTPSSPGYMSPAPATTTWQVRPMTTGDVGLPKGAPTWTTWIQFPVLSASTARRTVAKDIRRSLACMGNWRRPRRRNVHFPPVKHGDPCSDLVSRPQGTGRGAGGAASPGRPTQFRCPFHKPGSHPTRCATSSAVTERLRWSNR
jgi:hypothetical protein